jgi:hypothetical protein
MPNGQPQKRGKLSVCVCTVRMIPIAPTSAADTPPIYLYLYLSFQNQVCFKLKRNI